MGALANLENRLPAVEPGGQASVAIRVRNTGSVVDQFAFQILGDAGAWTTVQPADPVALPGGRGDRDNHLPPATRGVRPGRPNAVRRARHLERGPNGSVVEEGVLNIAPFSDVFAELAPRTSRGSGGATHDLAIDNRGNATLNAAIEAIDPDRLLTFDIRPPGVLADAGTASFSKVAVKPRRRFWRGPSQTRPFQVLIQQPSAPPLTVDGTLVQEAILPPWFMRALLALLGLLVLAVVLWFLLVKPAIEATATEQTADTLAAYGITPPPGAPGGGPGAPTPAATTGTGQPGASPSAPVVVGLAN